MRLGLLTTLFLCFATANGCMVIDEIDNANAKMPASAKKKKTEEKIAAPSGESKSDRLLRQSKQWWESATSVTSERVDSGIVRCQISGGTQFMARDDCTSRGGVPGGV